MRNYLRTHRSSTYFLLAFGYLVLAIIFLIVGLHDRHACKTCCYVKFNQMKFILLAVLLLGPPLWFLIEYNYMYEEGASGEPGFEKFKYNQELASRVWAAVSAIALAIALKND